MSTSLWIPRSNPQARVRLFCLPYAGGGASIYRLWSRKLPSDIDVCPVQLPGHENRVKEPLFTRLPPLIEALAHEVAPLLDKPFAFFGHSMGAVLSFELARYLRRHGQSEPGRLFISAHRAPQLPLGRELLYTLPAPEFLRSVYRMGGTPPAVLLNQELVRLILPILRADFTLYETYTYEEEMPFTFPITVFGGEQDKLVATNQLEAWKTQTTSAFALHVLPGDHFFIQSLQDLLLRFIEQDLARL